MQKKEINNKIIFINCINKEKIIFFFIKHKEINKNMIKR